MAAVRRATAKTVKTIGQKLTREFGFEELILLFKPVFGTPTKVVGVDVTVVVVTGVVVPLVRGTAGLSESGVVLFS